MSNRVVGSKRRFAYVHTVWLVAAVLAASACSKTEEAPAEPVKEPVAAPVEAPPEPTAEAEEAPAEPEVAEAPPAAAPVVVKGGFATPESVLHDTDADLYLVSNVNGQPLDEDGNGFISRVDVLGQVSDLKWIDGEKEGVTLNAPKGMAIASGVLYVADIHAVRKFDAKTGEPKGEIAIKGSTFLNDVVAGPDGAIYVSDSGLKAGKEGFEPSETDAVYKIVDDKAQSIAKGTELGRPNGLLMDGADLLVVSYGGNELYKLVEGKKADVRQLPKGTLDGILKTKDGSLLISSWEGKSVFRASGEAPFAEVLTGLNAPADIGYDEKRNRILVPLFMDNELRLIPLQTGES